MRQHTATFANFICKFGDKNLLDYAKEVVIPAFTRDTYVRSFGDRTHYHFYEVELLNVADADQYPIWVLAGRFIKDTELRREQIFDEEKGLIKDSQSMRSAPSAFFILILNNHRLIYFPETAHAPDLSSFKATTRDFLKRRHKEYIDEIYTALRDAGERATKKALLETHPWPNLEVVSLTGRTNIEAFIQRFEKLRKIEFRVVRPNDDINAGEILNEVRELSNALGSKDTKLVAANNKDGLDKDATIEAVAEATATGNQDVTVVGFDVEGNKLNGNNEKFNLTAPITPIPPTKRGLITKLLSVFSGLNAAGTINSPPIYQENENLNDF